MILGLEWQRSALGAGSDTSGTYGGLGASCPWRWAAEASGRRVEALPDVVGP